MNTYFKTTYLTFFLILIGAISLNAQSFKRNAANRYDLNKVKVKFVVPAPFSEQNQKKWTEILDTYWSFSENVELVDREIFEPRNFMSRMELVVYFRNVSISSTNSVNFGASINQFILSIKGKKIATIFINNSVGKADYVYALKMAEYIIQHRRDFSGKWLGAEKNILVADQMKSKTLLIPKRDLNRISLSTIKRIYPYKVEIAEQKVIDQKVLENDPNYLAIYHSSYLWKDGTTSFIKILYSTEDSAIVGASTPKMSFYNSHASHDLKSKDFMNFLKTLEE